MARVGRARGQSQSPVDGAVSGKGNRVGQPHRAETTPAGSLGWFEGLSDVVAVFVLLRRVGGAVIVDPRHKASIIRALG